ncbi:extracellular solute-binding protein [Agrobacterium tumefaciens]|uniref:extracellular solute-binding protein n=1 Tax=Agrobacterium tumefaciens TaxID=358 RepID=UPI0015721A66|nr:extracellular solute-binding protein [Agrobacterium tumefaciens]NTE68161.1 extracellular solute-binding protein [Agrobacterium tumefaciens]
MKRENKAPLFALLSFICSLVAAEPAWTRDLSVLYTDPQLMKPVHEAFSAEFATAHPGEQVKFTVASQYTEALQRTLRDAITGSEPDLSFQGLNNICVLADRGLAKPFDDLIAGDEGWKKQGLPPEALDIGKCHGKIYGIPLGISFPVVKFNKALVKQAGGNPDELPRTWPEIFALAKKIQASSGGIYFTYDSQGHFTFMGLVLSLGGKILSEDGKAIAFDSPEGLAAVRIIAQIATLRAGVDMTPTQARQAFKAGSLGIILDSSSNLPGDQQAAAGHFEIGVIPMPLTENGRLSPSGMAAVLLTDDADAQRQAWDYVKYASSAEGQTVVGQLTGFVPLNRSAINDPAFLGQVFSKDPTRQVVASNVEHMTAWPVFPGPNGPAINQAILDQLQNVATLKATPEEALKKMSTQATALLQK